MKNVLYAGYLCYAILLCSLLIGLFRYKILDSASKILLVLVGTDSIFELVAHYVGWKYKNNIPVYTVHSLVEFGILCIYFSHSIDVLVKNKVGYYIGVTGILLGLANIVFLQGLNRMNSYFLIFEGLCIIGMALFAFFRLLLQHESLRLHKYHHFWFSIILTFFWSVTFLNWSLYDYLSIHYKDDIWVVNISILIVNIITYAGISAVFYLYPKMQQGDD